MKIRPIDANALQELCNRGIQNMWNTGVAPVSWAAAYADFKNDIDSIPTLTPPNEWVSVEERLPEVDDSVLVHIIDTFDNRENIVITKYTIGLNLKMEWLGFEHNSFKVTHWMPLPAPPKKEK